MITGFIIGAVFAWVVPFPVVTAKASEVWGKVFAFIKSIAGMK